MNTYSIGRDVEQLSCRLERVEASIGLSPNQTAQKAAGLSHEHRKHETGTHHEPHSWHPEKAVRLPSFLYQAMGFPYGVFDLVPESITWHCNPEPLILYVTWNNGGQDEFYRLQDQSFSKIRAVNPNTSQVTCSVNYTAQLVASGKGRSHENYGSNGVFYYSSEFVVTLRNVSGGAVGTLTSPPYSIFCHDNYLFFQTWNIDPGVYDLITGATWQIDGAQLIDGC
jgi:hypothetical protein